MENPSTGKSVIAFTHKPVLGDDPRRCREPAPDRRRHQGRVHDLSANNPAHADRLAELGIAPIVTVLARTYARRAVRHRFKQLQGHVSE
ncbi:MAG: hypothetical protein WA633_01785 [Stellaceae bacterium]